MTMCLKTVYTHQHIVYLSEIKTGHQLTTDHLYLKKGPGDF